VIAALLAGTALAIAALCYVLYPLFFGVETASAPSRGARRAAPAEATDREEAVAVLREIEFDRATGKLGDTDYAELKAQWTEHALVAMRAEDATRTLAPLAPVADDATLDPAERAIRRARATAAVCPVDGTRPEPDARYCSDCGRWLEDKCASCGAPVTGEGARFCNACGTALAA
jgi:Double zinc ribbon